MCGISGLPAEPGKTAVPFRLCLRSRFIREANLARYTSQQGQRQQKQKSHSSKKSRLRTLTPLKVEVKVKSLSRVRLFATPWTAVHQALRPWDFPGESTGVGCHFSKPGGQSLQKGERERASISWELPKTCDHLQS